MHKDVWVFCPGEKKRIRQRCMGLANLVTTMTTGKGDEEGGEWLRKSLVWSLELISAFREIV